MIFFIPNFLRLSLSGRQQLRTLKNDGIFRIAAAHSADAQRVRDSFPR